MCFETFASTAVQITDCKKMKIYAVGLIRAKMLVVELVRVDLKPIRGKITKLSNGLNMQE